MGAGSSIARGQALLASLGVSAWLGLVAAFLVAVHRMHRRSVAAVKLHRSLSRQGSGGAGSGATPRLRQMLLPRSSSSSPRYPFS